jgi:hypothetical protein
MPIAAESIRVLQYAPQPREERLSIDLKVVDQKTCWAIATSLGFEPELVEFTPHGGGKALTHCLLWQGDYATAPPDLADKYDLLTDHFGSPAVRHTLGKTAATARFSHNP